MTLPHFQLHSDDMNVVKVLLEVEDCQWQDAGEGGQMPKKAIQVLTDWNILKDLLQKSHEMNSKKTLISQKLQCGYYGLGDCQPLYIGRALAKDPRSFHQSLHLDIISHLVWFDFLFNPMYTDYLFFHLKALCSWKHKCLHRWNSKLKGSIPKLV